MMLDNEVELERKLGRMIRMRRLKRGLTIVDLIHLIGRKISSPYVASVEAKGIIPSPVVLARIAACLGFETETLFNMAKKIKMYQCKKYLNEKYRIKIKLKHREKK